MIKYKNRNTRKTVYKLCRECVLSSHRFQSAPFFRLYVFSVFRVNFVTINILKGCATSVSIGKVFYRLKNGRTQSGWNVFRRYVWQAVSSTIYNNRRRRTNVTSGNEENEFLFYCSSFVHTAPLDRLPQNMQNSCTLNANMLKLYTMEW